ncbi:hypothetical protein RhiirB3_381862 [Rhizophagus irregularis]|nr:hypothetical protein RhiirB3_381862 [Rhizophagus irregularis]
MGFGWVKMNTNSPPYTFHADAEAKKGLDVQPIFINPKFVPDATISSFWDSIGTIDRDIRKFSKTITDAQTFDSFTHNTKLQDTFSHHKLSDINWPVTQAWLKHNETSDCTYCCITSFHNSSSPRGPHQQTHQSIQHHKTTSNRINVTTANQIIFRHLVQTYRRYETMGTGGGYHYLEEETPQETMSPTD